MNEYKQTLNHTKEEIKYLRAGHVGRSVLPDVERSKRFNELKDIDSYYSFLLYAESNLLAVINHLEPSGKKRDIKKKSLDELTFVVDPDHEILHCVDKYSHDTILDAESAVREYKIQLIKDILKGLSKEKRDILDLYSRGFTHKEISEMLDCSRQKITVTIKNIRKKISDEGWMMA